VQQVSVLLVLQALLGQLVLQGLLEQLARVCKDHPDLLVLKDPLDLKDLLVSLVLKVLQVLVYKDLQV
jgi:hypothetical protein